MLNERVGMTRKVITGIILTLLLTGMLTLAFNIQSVKASGTVYIRADGSIDPPTAPISSVDIVTYTFTGNINDEIVVERDNIVIDGAGYTLRGTGSGTGIDLGGRSNVTIKNAEIKSFKYGILFDGSSNNVISRNNITHNDRGIQFFEEEQMNNTICGNHITSNMAGVVLLRWCSKNTISENNINENTHGIRLEHCSNNVISRNNGANNEDGIVLLGSSNNVVSGNTVTENSDGIMLDQSSNNTLRNNVASSNKYNFGVYGSWLSHYTHDIDDSNTVNGKPIYYWINRRHMTVPLDAGYVALVNCTNITVQALNLTNNGQGVILASTTNSTITKNNIGNNEYSILLLESSKYNTVFGNNIANNEYGIGLGDSSNNIIYHNDFVDNSEQVHSLNSVNIWDDGYPSGGNYWSDHVCTGNPSDGSWPYVINENNVDHYPFSACAHEIIMYQEAPAFLETGGSSLLNATVYNRGRNNETAVKVQFLVDSSLVDEKTIPSLTSGSSANLTFPWTAPGVEGVYDLTIYAVPVAGETNTDNNRLSQMISIYEPVWYIDDEKNFEILVPHGWTYESDVRFDTDIADVVLYGPTEDGFMVSINVVSGFDSEVKETETYLVNIANEGINVISSEFGDLQVIESPICTTINGQAAVVYILQYQYEGFTLKNKQAIIVSDEDDYYWIITATASAGNYEKYEPIFDATIESFKFQAPPGPSPSPSFWWVLPVIAVIIFIAVAVIVLIRRRKKSIPPEAATPTETPTQLVTEEKVEGAPSVEARKRPTGLTIIAILWFLGGIYNLYMSSQVISDDLEVLPHLSESWVAEWFKFGVPAELAINLLVCALGIIQMFTIIGLWTGKSWSYKLALAIPVLAVVSWISMAGLYISAPIELGIRESINWVPIGASIIWMIIYWSYLRKPHVKEYLRV